MAELFVENAVKPYGVRFKAVTDRGTDFCDKVADAMTRADNTAATTSWLPELGAVVNNSAAAASQQEVVKLAAVHLAGQCR